jgi:hypothetical protein
MPFFTAQGASPAALANGSMVFQIVPAAAVNFHLTKVMLSMSNAGGALTDFQCVVGLNRATARGTSSATATTNKVDPNSGATQITGVDSAVSVQPTLAAADGWQWGFNTRGTIIDNYQLWEILSNVGTANPLSFINRSGAALPGSHVINWYVEWFE